LPSDPFLLLQNQVIQRTTPGVEDRGNTDFLDFESEVGIMCQLCRSPSLVRIYGVIDPNSADPKKITLFQRQDRVIFRLLPDNGGQYFRERIGIVMGMFLAAVMMRYFLIVLLQNAVTVLLVMR
jgi:hypothetical protein